MADVFISYNREDQPTARLYAEVIEAAGLSVWWDTTLKTGEEYDEVTESALRDAKAVVVLWSPRSVASRWVRAEATLADRAKKLLPVMIEPCERPIMFELIQTADLAHWSGAPNDLAWLSFIGDVHRLVGKAASPVSAPARAAPHAKRHTLLAVLAFDNLSHDPDIDYFSDGISEEILYTISRTKGLRVIGKASSFQFRGPDKTPKNVRDALGASHMLDGSIRRAGDNIRINIELVDTESFETLWSERYDRALTDIFSLQDEIAAAVATAMHRHFMPARASLPVDPVAYDLYLQALAIFAADMTWADQAKCVALLEVAVARAPEFAQAWGRLAIFLSGEAAVAAANRGLGLDPDCAASLAALARTQPSFAMHAKKLELSSQAYRLAPDDVLISGVHMLTSMSAGLLTQARKVVEVWRANDPLSPQTAGNEALLCRYTGRNSEAIALADAALKQFPDSEFIKFIRGAIAIFDHDLETASAVAATVSQSAKVQSLLPPIHFMRAMASLDPETRAQMVTGFLHRKAPETFLLDVALASFVGEVGPAMDHLLDAIDNGRPIDFTADNDGRDPTGACVTVGLFLPLAKPLRSDRRFPEVCVKLGLYDCWKSLDVWPDCAKELSHLYDFKDECEKLAGKVGFYEAALQ